MTWGIKECSAGSSFLWLEIPVETQNTFKKKKKKKNCYNLNN